MLVGIFASLAEYERELMHERGAAARAAARLRGRHAGRPPRLTPAQTRQVRSLRDGSETITDLVSSFGVSRATIYRALQATDTAGHVPAPSVGFSRVGPGSNGRENDPDVRQ